MALSGLPETRRQEETFLEAYENEGWRGAARERVRPAAELERARLQVLPPACALGGPATMPSGEARAVA